MGYLPEKFAVGLAATVVTGVILIACTKPDIHPSVVGPPQVAASGAVPGALPAYKFLSVQWETTAADVDGYVFVGSLKYGGSAYAKAVFERRDIYEWRHRLGAESRPVEVEAPIGGK